MGFAKNSIIIGSSAYVAGNAPHTAELEIIPDSAGELVIAPRFDSIDHRTLYGGNALIINVDHGSVNYSVTVNMTGTGTVTSSPAGINCGSTCNVDFAQGTSVTLTADPADGWVFDGWSGACNGPDVICSFTVSKEMSVNAVFTQTSSGSKTTPLNDTGIDWGADFLRKNELCTGQYISAQDCSHGRDATHNDDSDGHAGFSYTKLDSDGNELPSLAASWSCVRDNVTGLIWEVKSPENGLQVLSNTYSWYDPDPNSNGGGRGGEQDGGSCEGSECDTHSYAQAINSLTIPLCGFRDWRMPDRGELRSIIDYGISYPTIDSEYFPYQRNDPVWTGTPDPRSIDTSWVVDFGPGFEGKQPQYKSYQVRLVRNKK